MSLAIVPGSFDPMTMGHRDLVLQVVEKYDTVVVAVMINAQKQYVFDIADRVSIAKATLADIPNVTVISDEGMLIDLYDRLGADAVCKGWRNQTDYDYEMKMADWNRAHNPRFRTVLLPSGGEHATLSSTEVRRKMERGESLEGLVHPNASPLVNRKKHG